MRRGWLLLLDPKVRSIGNRLRQPRERLLKPLVLGGLALGFWALTFYLFQRVLVYFRSVELFGDFLAAKLLAMILLTFFSILFISNILSSLSTFFLAEDVNLILCRPVGRDRLYYARLTEAAVHSSWMVLLFGMPVFLAYGWVYRAGPAYYGVLCGVLVPFLAIPAALGALFSMLVVNIFPARKTREVLILLAIALAIGLYFLMRFLQPERLVNPDAFAGLVEYMTAMNAPSLPFLPSFWASESLLPHILDGRATGHFYLALLWSTAGALVVIGTWVSRALFFSGWSKSQEGRRARFTQQPLAERLFRLLSRPFPRPMRSLAVKDFKHFFRDPTQWSQLILLAALVVVYLYNFSVLPLERAPMPTFFLTHIISFLNMGLAGFVLAAIAGRFAFPAVSLEGPAFWIIRASPLPLRGFLWCKFWTTLIPLLLLAEALILISDWLLKVTLFMTVLSAVTLFFMTFAIVGLGVGMGALYPRFRYENAAQVVSGFGGFVYMILALAFIGAVVVLEAWPVYTLFMASFRHRSLTTLEWAGVALSFAGVAVLNLLALTVPMRRGLRKLEEADHG